MTSGFVLLIATTLRIGDGPGGGGGAESPDVEVVGGWPAVLLLGILM